MSPVGPIDADNLMRAAEQKTGLHDWGARGFESRLRRLCGSLEAEKQLLPWARLGARQRILGYLVDRLRLRQLQTEDVELCALPLSSPVFITGYPRSGTTLLYQLLAEDPGFRAPAWWEVLLPLPPPSRVPDEQRIAAAQRIADASLKVASEVQAMHPVRDVREREEDFRLLERSFLSISYPMSYGIPDYLDWLFEQSDQVEDDCYAEYRDWLRVLMRHAGPGRWLSKTPAHLGFVAPLLRAFPDATVIYLEREPERSVASYCRLLSAIRQGTLSPAEPLLVGQHCLKAYREGVRRFGAALERYPSRIVILRYEDLLRRPLETVEALSERLGMAPGAVTAANIDRLLAGSRPAASEREYSLGDYGLSAREVERAALRFGR